MKVFIEAVKDLLTFFYRDLLVPNDSAPAAPTVANQLLISSPEAPKLLVAESAEKKVETEPIKVASFLNRFCYIVVAESRVYIRPVLTFDGESWHAPYGTKVELLEYEGRFAHIRDGARYGWVLKDDISEDPNDIFPNFNTGEIYSANHPETKKLRTLRGDEFVTRELYLPLQDVEFASFAISLKNLQIPFDERRPRMSGNWQNLLKGKPGVMISIAPKTNSIIEYTKEDGSGFVGVVSAVEVDETIKVSGVGRLIEGEYREEVFTRMEWQEWRPVFIQIL